MPIFPSAAKLWEEFSSLVGKAKPAESPLVGEFKALVAEHQAKQPGLMAPSQLLTPKIKPPPALAAAYAGAPKSFAFKQATAAPSAAIQPLSLEQQFHDILAKSSKPPMEATPAYTPPPKPAVAATPEEGWKQIGPQAGSNPGGAYADPQGGARPRRRQERCPRTIT